MHCVVTLNSLTTQGTNLRDIDIPSEQASNVDYQGIDRTTIFYDVFRAGPYIHTIGPPLRNFASHISLSRFSFLKRTHEMETKRFHHHIYSHRSFLKTFKPKFVLNIFGYDFNLSEIDEGPALIDDVVLVTMNKDNEISWIKDWILFNVDMHGVSAVVIYDNGSTKYRPQELSDALSALPVKTIVVDTPFPYGPKPVVVGGKRIFHDKYLQVAMLNHCLYRFARNSRLIINCDIDELVFAKADALEIMARNRAAAIHFRGDWISARLSGDSLLPTFFSFEMRILNPPHPVGLKWIVNPLHLAAGSYLTTHKVRGVKYVETEEVRIKHFRGISNNWKELRTAPNHDELTEVDLELKEYFHSSRN